MSQQADRFFYNILDKVNDCISHIHHIVFQGIMQASAMAVAVHGIHMEVSCQLWHDTEKTGAVYGLCMEQYQRFQIVSYFVVLNVCM